MHAQDDQNRLIFKTHEGVIEFEPDHILRCEADGSYTYVFSINGARKLLSKSLKYMSQILPAQTFVRVHYSHIVNIKGIKNINLDENYLQLKNSQIIPISRRKLRNLRDTVID